MRYIRKGPEPRALVEHRLSPHATYENLPKEELQERLAREQGFLCCYCMQRISPTPRGMKIEHWVAQSSSEDRRLDWRNLLGACLGNEGRPWREQHCDTRKGDAALTINPLDERCERLIHFLADGSVDSPMPAIQTDLQETLNLNSARLKNNRKAVLDAFLEVMRRKHSGSTWSEDILRRELAYVQEPDAMGMLRPYCQVPVYWLKKRLGLSGRPS
jgi:uncharacterized protein (TIGR02646 family)